jgi:hypothetical protein
LVHHAENLSSIYRHANPKATGSWSTPCSAVIDSDSCIETKPSSILTFTTPSWLPETTQRPSGLTFTCSIPCVCPCITASEQTTRFTAPHCALCMSRCNSFCEYPCKRNNSKLMRVCTRVTFYVSHQILRLASSEPDAKYSPKGWKSTLIQPADAVQKPLALLVATSCCRSNWSRTCSVTGESFHHCGTAVNTGTC